MKKSAVRILASAAAVTFLAVAPFSRAMGAQVFSRSTPANGACFYEDAEYRGSYFCINVGDSARSMPPGMNDRISSIRVFGRAEVTVYRDDDFRGGSARFRGNVRDLDDEDWNDTISSIRMETGSLEGGRFGGGERFRRNQQGPRQGACFYRDADFRGDRFCLARGETMASMPLGFNDEISSIEVFGGASVAIFEHEDFAGQSIRVVSGIRDLSDSRSPNGFRWNDTISSVRVF